MRELFLSSAWFTFVDWVILWIGGEGELGLDLWQGWRSAPGESSRPSLTSPCSRKDPRKLTPEQPTRIFVCLRVAPLGTRPLLSALGVHPPCQGNLSPLLDSVWSNEEGEFSWRGCLKGASCKSFLFRTLLDQSLPCFASEPAVELVPFWCVVAPLQCGLQRICPFPVWNEMMATHWTGLPEGDGDKLKACGAASACEVSHVAGRWLFCERPTRVGSPAAGPPEGDSWGRSAAWCQGLSWPGGTWNLAYFCF